MADVSGVVALIPTYSPVYVIWSAPPCIAHGQYDTDAVGVGVSGWRGDSVTYAVVSAHVGAALLRTEISRVRPVPPLNC